ncbi:hypothetical protein F0562_017197 [Nyssa sinensis]|uniref:Uncharacterized protein n=1 Tax=Nyssa sinensis TaxID=561372 RepID=A0A5J4ZEN8_9ASTE|nr:hypothetical protein F0562_017197 [Nyssa sinensis]
MRRIGGIHVLTGGKTEKSKASQLYPQSIVSFVRVFRFLNKRAGSSGTKAVKTETETERESHQLERSESTH